MVSNVFLEEIRKIARDRYPEFPIILLKSEIQKNIWDIEEIEKETSAMPMEELAHLKFDEERIKALRQAERKLHRITERERNAMKKII